MPLPPLQPADQSDHVATMLYIVDFLSQFSKVVAMQSITFQDFFQSLHATAAASGGGLSPGTALLALATPSAAVNGSVGATESVSCTVSGDFANGVAAEGGGDGQSPSSDSTPLFHVYRGLLQFLLQVSLWACGILVCHVAVCSQLWKFSIA